MAIVRDVCFLLGFRGNSLSSRGTPIVLTNDLESFSERWDWIKDERRLTDLYLNSNGGTMLPHRKDHPNLVGDRSKIHDLLTQAFKELRGTRDVEGALETAGSQTPPAATGMTTTSGRHPTSDVRAGLLAVSPAKGDKEAAVGIDGKTGTESMDLDQNVANTEFPIWFQSKIELVSTIKQWIDRHPHKRIPVLSHYDRLSFEANFATEASLADTGESVWVFRLGVIEQYQGWVLEKNDKCYVVVKAHYSRKYGHAYYPWVGGDEFDFSDEVIAHHQGVPRKVLSIQQYAKKKDLDAEALIEEYNVLKSDLASEGLKDRRASQTVSLAKKNQKLAISSEILDSSLSSSSDSESSVPLIARWKAWKKRCELFPLDIRPFREPKPPAKFQTKIKKSNAILYEPVKMSRISKPASKAKRRPLLKINVSDEAKRKERVSSKSGIQPPTPAKKISAIANPTECSNLFHTPPPPSRPQGPGLMAPFIPSMRNGPSFTMPMTPFGQTLPTPYATPPISTEPFTFHKGTASKKSGALRFYFFAANPTLGAIPTIYGSFPTKEKFFKDAITAHAISSTSFGSKEVVFAASVLVFRTDRAIIVQKDKQGKGAWDEVKRSIDSKIEMKGSCEVEVRCIVGH
ncbi:MAG: hypothetical protein Q9201_000063 [Fulgogasparrea decipioides]